MRGTDPVISITAKRIMKMLRVFVTKSILQSFFSLLRFKSIGGCEIVSFVGRVADRLRDALPLGKGSVVRQEPLQCYAYGLFIGAKRSGV